MIVRSMGALGAVERSRVCVCLRGVCRSDGLRAWDRVSSNQTFIF